MKPNGSSKRRLPSVLGASRNSPGPGPTRAREAKWGSEGVVGGVARINLRGGAYPAAIGAMLARIQLPRWSSG
jgi:hypothetical protein